MHVNDQYYNLGEQLRERDVDIPHDMLEPIYIAHLQGQGLMTNYFLGNKVSK